MKEFKFSYSAKVIESNVTIAEGLKPAYAGSIPDIEESATMFFDLATGVTDQERLIAPVNGSKFLVIEYDQDITVKLNLNTNTAITLNTYGTIPTGILIIQSAAVTSLHFSNSSGNTAKVKMFYGY